jgi:hypothetical protein
MQAHLTMYNAKDRAIGNAFLVAQNDALQGQYWTDQQIADAMVEVG